MGGVQGVPIVTNSKIDAALSHSPAIADAGNDFPGPYTRTNPAKNGLIMSIKCHKPLAVVDNEQEAISAEPVSIYDSTRTYSLDYASMFGVYESSFPS